MDKQIIANNLEKSILDRVRSLLTTLPNNISTENKEIFSTVCERISDITTDAFTEAESLGCRDFFSGWRRLLVPFWRNGYGKWEYAYGDRFTWKQFLDYIIESNCNDVEVIKDRSVPVILFTDKQDVNQFCIELGKED